MTKTRKVLIIVCTLVLMCETRIETNAQTTTSPSLKETTDFIASKIGNSVLVADGFSSSVNARVGEKVTEHVSFTGCKVSVRVHYVFTQQDPSAGTWDIESGEFDARFLTTTSARIGLDVPDDRWNAPIYSIVIPLGDGGHDHFSSARPFSGKVALFIDDRGLGDRLLKAFTGLAKLCGAKDEPY
jgi:hypothetical protein